MTKDYCNQMFDVTGKVAVITGGGGVLCKAMAHGLVQTGVKVAVLDLNLDSAKQVAEDIKSAGGQAAAFECDVLEHDSILKASLKVLETFKRVDILINGAGGNKPQATTNANQTFFEISPDAVKLVFDLNMIGTLLPSQVFGKTMADQGEGVILNISSMNAFRPLTRIPAYSAAKAAVSNFTQWLAVNLAQEFTPKIRVNAIAPGFFLTDQNRFLLTDKESGELTTRGKTILSHTPQNRFGTPEDLIGTILWLVSPASEFVTGIVVPVDGGFSAFSGV